VNRVVSEVASWAGVTSHPHRFGGVELRLGRRELGHLHGDTLADLPFPKRVSAQLIAEGRALPHHVPSVRDSGWVSKPIRTDADAEDAIALFRLAYDRATAAAARRGA
jgi:hypothetical protein